MLLTGSLGGGTVSSLARDLICVDVHEYKASVSFLLCLGLAQREARIHNLKYEV